MTKRRTKNKDDMGEVLDFMRSLWALHHGLQSRSKRMATTVGVTGPQRLAIRLLGRYPDITPGALAELLHMHPSTLTGILARLEDRGFVKREAHPEDGRKMLLSLTPIGRAIDAQKGATAEASVQKVLKKATKTDVEATQRLLQLLADELDDDGYGG